MRTSKHLDAAVCYQQGEIAKTNGVLLRIKADFEFWLHEAWLAGASLGFELGARMTIVGCHNSI